MAFFDLYGLDMCSMKVHFLYLVYRQTNDTNLVNAVITVQNIFCCFTNCQKSLEYKNQKHIFTIVALTW